MPQRLRWQLLLKRRGEEGGPLAVGLTFGWDGPAASPLPFVIAELFGVVLALGWFRLDIRKDVQI
jgi:hypothetical protein